MYYRDGVAFIRTLNLKAVRLSYLWMRQSVQIKFHLVDNSNY